jgi:hypothetical protein
MQGLKKRLKTFLMESMRKKNKEEKKHIRLALILKKEFKELRKID